MIIQEQLKGLAFSEIQCTILDEFKLWILASKPWIFKCNGAKLKSRLFSCEEKSTQRIVLQTDFSTTLKIFCLFGFQQSSMKKPRFTSLVPGTTTKMVEIPILFEMFQNHTIRLAPIRSFLVETSLKKIRIKVVFSPITRDFQSFPKEKFWFRRRKLKTFFTFCIKTVIEKVITVLVYKMRNIASSTTTRVLFL